MSCSPSNSWTLEAPASHTPSPTSSYSEEMSHNLNPSRQYKDRLILGTKEIEFTVPPTLLSPLLTPTHGKISAHGFWSGDSSPGSGRSECDLLSSGISRGTSPSPIFFSSHADITGTGCHLYGLNPELYKDTENFNHSNSKQNSFDNDSANCCSYVSFEVNYDQDNERLLIKNLKGHHFKFPKNTRDEESSSNMEKNQTYIPRVRIFLYPDERRILQSSIQTMETGKNLDVIEYDETFGFQVSEIELEERCIQICFDTYDNTNRKYDLFGYARAHIKNIDWASAQNQTQRENLIYIGEESKMMEEKPLESGEIFVSLCYNSNISRLTVSLFQVKGIKFTGNETGLYAKILFNQNTKNIKTKKTSNISIPDISSQKEPSFDESFNFKLNPDQVETSTVIIQLRVTRPGYNKYHEVGKVILGPTMFAKGRGHSHWTKMMKNQKEQVRCWQKLSNC